MELTFGTHNGEAVTGKKLQYALNKVADDWAQLARDIRSEDAYASHVTEEYKDQAMNDMIERAEEIRTGKIESFTIWQRVNEVLTGECVGFLPK